MLNIKVKKFLKIFLLIGLCSFVIISLIVVLAKIYIINSQNNSAVVSENDSEMYDKWRLGQEAYNKKTEILNDLLNKYYPDEMSRLYEMSEEQNNSGSGIPIGLTEYSIKKVELIVKLYKEQNLNQEEREICKDELRTYYKEQNENKKFTDNLNLEVENILGLN